MKQYYANGKKVTAEEAAAIEAKNREYMSSNSMEDWAKCQFITAIERPEFVRAQICGIPLTD